VDFGGAEDRLVLVFNFAYNPSCAYDRAWAFPLAHPAVSSLRPSMQASSILNVDRTLMIDGTHPARG
jgi:uncharacterized protein (DUF1684 family)